MYQNIDLYNYVFIMILPKCYSDTVYAKLFPHSHTVMPMMFRLRKLKLGVWIFNIIISAAENCIDLKSLLVTAI